jgi:HlyD family secretion protein
VVWYRFAVPAGAETPDPTEDPTVDIVEIQRETLVDTVNATGRIEPKAEVDMQFEIGGVVEEVLVERGQRVAAGTILARLDTGDLSWEIQRAKIDLAQQEAELENLFEPVLAEKIASAEAEMESARLKLSELLDGPDPDEVAMAEAELSLKQIAVKKAQQAYDEVSYRGDVGSLPQADQLQQATLEYEKAQADYNLKTKEPTPAEIASARASLANAEANLAELLKEPTAAEIMIKQAAIDKARLSLAEKEAALEEAVLVAPTEGTVLEVNIEPGERVLSEAETPVMVIANTSAYLLKVEVDEIDIARIARGQPATIVLDALSDRELQGEVADVSPSPAQGDDSSGIVMYEVTLSIDPVEGKTNLLPGMTATAAVETRRLEGVVVVPNQALQFDRETNPPLVYVEKLNGDGSPTRVEVELGLRDGTQTEVVAGLEAGDQILVRNQPEPGGAASPSL